MIFFRLWTHEVMRVFYDRLIEIGDREWLFATAKVLVRDHFKENFEMIMSNIVAEGRRSVSFISQKFYKMVIGC